MSRKGVPYRCRDEFRLNAPHTFPANRTVTQVARMARDLATDRQVRKSPWRRTLRRGRTPDRYDRTSDRRRDMHWARIGAERNRALPKNCEQIAQACSVTPSSSPFTCATSSISSEPQSNTGNGACPLALYARAFESRMRLLRKIGRLGHGEPRITPRNGRRTPAKRLGVFRFIRHKLEDARAILSTSPTVEDCISLSRIGGCVKASTNDNNGAPSRGKPHLRGRTAGAKKI